MKRVIASVTFLFILCAIALSIGGVGIESAGAQAQKKAAAPPPPPPPRMFLAVTTVQVKPDSITEWLDLQRNEVIPAAKKGGLKFQEVWTTGVFGEGFQYVTVRPITSFAQFDSDSPQVRALGQEGSRALAAKIRRLINSTHTTAYQTRPDLGYEGTSTAQPQLMIVTSVKVASGRNLEFESLVKNTVAPTMKRAGMSAYSVGQVVYGGDANEYVTLVPIPNFADNDKGSPFARADGPNGLARFLPRTYGIVLSAERSIMRLVPDLTFTTP